MKSKHVYMHSHTHKPNQASKWRKRAAVKYLCTRHKKPSIVSCYLYNFHVSQWREKMDHRNRSITATGQIHGRLYFYQSAATKTLLLSPYKAHTQTLAWMYTHTCMHTYPHSLCCVVCVCACACACQLRRGQTKFNNRYVWPLAGIISGISRS